MTCLPLVTGRQTPPSTPPSPLTAQARGRSLLSSSFPGPVQVLYHLTDLPEEETEDPSLGDGSVCVPGW